MTVESSPPRPSMVMVTGEPGSGKTALSRELSTALRVPVLSRDHIRGGLLATAGLWTDQLDDPPTRESAVEALVELVEAAARLGVMAVVELVVTPPRLDAWHRLQEAADWVVVLTECSGAAARADRRDRADPLLNRADVLAALGHESIDDYLAGGERDVIRATMQREFDVPVLRVDTDDGYNPEMPAIVDWIIEQTRHHD